MRVLVVVESTEKCNLHNTFYMGFKALEGTEFSAVDVFSLPRHVLVSEKADMALFTKIKKFKPSFIAVMKGTQISPRFFAMTNKTVCPVIFYQIDDPFEIRDSLLWGRGGSYSITTDKKSLDTYVANNIKCEFFPFTFYDYGINNERKYVRDCVFIGTPYQCRHSFMANYCAKGSNYKIDLYGFGYLGSKPRVSHEEAFRIAAETKINFVFSDQPDGRTGLKNKLFEMMGQGCFCLVQKCPDLDEMFVAGEYFDTFINPDDIAVKIKYWTTYEANREETARKGMEAVRSKYTSQHLSKRIKEIFLRGFK